MKVLKIVEKIMREFFEFIGICTVVFIILSSLTPDPYTPVSRRW